MKDQDSSIRATVIIPTLNRGKLLINPLKALIEEEYPGFDIMVVDQSDNPDAKVRDFCMLHSERIRYFNISTKGLPNARNFGIKQARSEILIFVDDDVVLSPGFVRGHVSKYSDSAVIGVAGRVLESDESTNADFIGETYPRYVTKIRWWDGRQYDNFDSSIDTEADHSQGCNMSFRRSALLEISGFDRRFGGSAHLEETDVCVRLRRQNMKMVFAPDATLLHLKDSSGGCRQPDWRKWFFWYGHNFVLFYYKNFPKRRLPLLTAMMTARMFFSTLIRKEPLAFLSAIAGIIAGINSSIVSMPDYGADG